MLCWGRIDTYLITFAMAVKKRCSSRFPLNINSNGGNRNSSIFHHENWQLDYLDKIQIQNPKPEETDLSQESDKCTWRITFAWILAFSSQPWATVLSVICDSLLPPYASSLEKTNGLLTHFAPFLQSTPHGCSTIFISAYCWRELWLNITMLTFTCLFTGNVSFLSLLTSGNYPSVRTASALWKQEALW